jgi:hypothetical protein
MPHDMTLCWDAMQKRGHNPVTVLDNLGRLRVKSCVSGIRPNAFINACTALLHDEFRQYAIVKKVKPDESIVFIGVVLDDNDKHVLGTLMFIQGEKFTKVSH